MQICVEESNQSLEVTVSERSVMYVFTKLICDSSDHAEALDLLDENHESIEALFAELEDQGFEEC